MSGKKQDQGKIDYSKVQSLDKGVTDLYQSPGQQNYDGTQIKNEYYDPIDYSKLQNDFNKRLNSNKFDGKAYSLNTGVGTIVTFDSSGAVNSARNNINQASSMPDIGRTLSFDKVSQIGSVVEGFDKNAKDYMENLVNETYDIKNGMQLMPWQQGYIDPTDGARQIAKINKLFDDYKNNIGSAYGYASDLKDAYKKKEGEVGAVSLTNLDRTNEAMLLSQWTAGDPNVYLIDNDGETALYRPSLNGKPEAILNLSKFGSAMEQEGDYISRVFDYKSKLDGVGEQYIGSIDESGKKGYIQSVVDYDLTNTPDGNQVIQASSVRFKPGMYEKSVEAAAKGDPVIQRIMDSPEQSRQMWLDVFKAPVPYDPNRDKETLRNLIARKAINDKGIANAMGRTEGSYVIGSNGEVVSFETFVDAPSVRSTSVKDKKSPPNDPSAKTKTYDTQFEQLQTIAHDIKISENNDDITKALETGFNQLKSGISGAEQAQLKSSESGFYFQIPANQKNEARNELLFTFDQLKSMKPKKISEILNNKLLSIPKASEDMYFNDYDESYNKRFGTYFQQNEEETPEAEAPVVESASVDDSKVFEDILKTQVEVDNFNDMYSKEDIMNHALYSTDAAASSMSRLKPADVSIGQWKSDPRVVAEAIKIAKKKIAMADLEGEPDYFK